MNINELEELAKAQPKGRVKSDYLAAANPSAIRELISAYRESVAALRAMVSYARADRCGLKIADDALDTAKRLGVE